MKRAKPFHPDFDPTAEPLVDACAEGDLKTVRSLVKSGVPVNAIGSKHTGYYPLHAAAKAGHENIVKYLLSTGARVDVRTEAQLEQRADTPLLIAVDKGHLKTVRALVEAGADVNAHSRQRNTPLGRAIQRNNHALIDYLVAHGARPDGAHLRLAAGGGNIYAMEKLLGMGFKISDGEDQDGTLLHRAISVIRPNQLEMVSYLLDHGADINQASGDFNFAATPLLRACSPGRWEIANYLLERGADPSLGSKFKDFPLNHTVRIGGYEMRYGPGRGSYGTAQKLVEAGAKLDSVDFESKTPLEWTVENRDKAMFQLLVKHGAQVPKKLIPTITRRFGKDILK
jgi:ankyrin repeat protein